MSKSSTSGPLDAASPTPQELESVRSLDARSQDILCTVMPQIMEGMDVGVLVTDSQGNVLYGNPAAERLLNRTDLRHLRDLAGVNLQKALIRASISAGHDDAVSRPAEECVSWDQAITQGDQTRVLALRTRLIRNKGQKQRVFFIQDVTTLRLAERSLAGATHAGIRTRDPQMLRAIQLIEQVAKSDASVLIQGESGSGKGMLARLLHQSSARANQPLVEVNCAAIPDNLWEAEFFGAVKGAYTGAFADRIGRFAAADGGTLFLDEVGELSKHHQAKLLKVIEEQAFEPVGTTKTQRVDVRIVAATNRGLKQAVERGDFRADLYYRLNVIPIEVPPLRERHTDIVLLANVFLDDLGQGSSKRLSTETKHLLLDYAWPGNVRELRNIMEYAAICAPGEEIQISDLPQEFVERAQRHHTSSHPTHSNQDAEGQDQERAQLQELLDKHQNNRSAVARELGIDRVTLWRRMSRLGMAPANEA